MLFKCFKNHQFKLQKTDINDSCKIDFQLQKEQLGAVHVPDEQ